MPLDRQRAFVRLFRGKTYDSVWNWLRRLGVPRRDRRDILQDVFLAGYQSFPSYDPLRARPERWLNRITVHVAAHYRDRAHHRREELSSGHAPRRVADERPNAEEQIDAAQTRSLILSRLRSLQAEEQRILIQHDIEGVPMATVAEQHGIPLSTAYKWRTRALASLRALIEEPRAERRHQRPPRPTASNVAEAAARSAKGARSANTPRRTALAERPVRSTTAGANRPAAPCHAQPKGAPFLPRPGGDRAHSPARA